MFFFTNIIQRINAHLLFRLLWIVCLSGTVIFLLTCSIAAIARMYEIRLLKLSGTNSAAEYPEYLHVRALTLLYYFVVILTANHMTLYVCMYVERKASNAGRYSSGEES